MDTNVPYMPSVRNVHAILRKMQSAAVPEAFGRDFLKDLGFTSSNDRPVIGLLRYLGMLDALCKPQACYSEFVDQTKSKSVLAARLRIAYDDLFSSNKEANKKSVTELKGWFKTKTGASDSVAEKIATTFKCLVEFSDFSAPSQGSDREKVETKDKDQPKTQQDGRLQAERAMSLVYRLEIHLPDTQNIQTFRSIFKALREELM